MNDQFVITKKEKKNKNTQLYRTKQSKKQLLENIHFQSIPKKKKTLINFIIQ